MPRVTVSEPIDARADLVFAIATDLANAPAVIPDITEISVLTDGPFGEGTTWKETRVMFGKECTETMKVIAFEPGHSYTTLAGSQGCEYRTTVRVEPDPASPHRCTLTYDMRARAKSFKARLMMPMFVLMKGMIRKAFAKDLACVRAAAEAPEPVPA